MHAATLSAVTASAVTASAVTASAVTASAVKAPRRREAEIAAAATELGYIAVALFDDRVCGVSFGHNTAAAAEGRVHGIAQAVLGGGATVRLGGDAVALNPATVLARLTDFAAGEAEELYDIPLLLSGMTPFQQRVVAACRAIPYGGTRTYGQLAASAGSPGAARAVGQVMAANRIPLIVPCHRVVAASGGLGGFSAPQGIAMKQRLLAMEQAGVAAAV